MLPDPKTKCHLTGFTKSCLKLVSSGACTRWKTLPINDPGTGQDKWVYDCIDNHAHDLRWCLLRAVDQAAASTDKVATEVKKTRDENAGMSAIAIQRANETIAEAVEKINETMREAITAAPSQLLIEDSNAIRNS